MGKKSSIESVKVGRVQVAQTVPWKRDEVRRLRIAMVELAHAIEKSEPNIASRTHLRTFWELLED